MNLVCKNKECKLKNDCARFTLKPEGRQRYQNFTRLDCSYFIKKRHHDG